MFSFLVVLIFDGDIYFNISLIEYDDYNTAVGSLDEQECISPTDANQWMFDRNRGQASLDTFLAENENIQEQDEDIMEFDGKQRRDSENFQLPELDDIQKAKLLSCMEEIRNIVGESISDKRITEAIMAQDYDFTKALDMLLTTTTTSQPSKKPRVTEVEKGNEKSRNVHEINFIKL